jgi:hypothetical protein
MTSRGPRGSTVGRLAPEETGSAAEHERYGRVIPLEDSRAVMVTLETLVLPRSILKIGHESVRLMGTVCRLHCWTFGETQLRAALWISLANAIS